MGIGVLRNKNFILLWGSQIFSQLTVNFLTFLLLIRIFEETGSAFATSFIWISNALPAILIGPFAASFVDMVDRKKVLAYSNIIQFLIILTFSFLYGRYLYFSYLVVLGYSIFNQFYIPAEAASLPVLVKKKNLAQANGLFFLTQQTSLIAGFGIAGVLNEHIGFGNTLFISSIFLFLAFLSVSGLPSMKMTKTAAEKIEERVKRFFTQIFEGYVFLKSKRLILMAFLLLLTMEVSIAILASNLPSVARQIIGIDPNSSSIYVVVPAGIGAILGAVVIPRFLSRGIRKKNVIQVSLLLISVDILLLVLVEPELIESIRVYVGMLLFSLAGFFFLGLVIPAQTFLQENTPRDMLGRVYGNFWFLVTAASVFPVLFSATISDVLGVGTMLIVLSGVSIVSLFVSEAYYQLTKETWSKN